MTMCPSETLRVIEIEIPTAFDDFIDASLMRLQSRFIELTFKRTPHGVNVIGAEHHRSVEIQAIVQHALYREKIYAETLSMRQALMETLLR